jgi:hypothetical protein
MMRICIIKFYIIAFCFFISCFRAELYVIKFLQMILLSKIDSETWFFALKLGSGSFEKAVQKSYCKALSMGHEAVLITIIFV